LLIFLVVAVVTSQLVGRARASLTAATARERESTWLYELSTALAGLNDDQAISHTLAEHAFMHFQADLIEVSLEATPGGKPLLVQMPTDQTPSVSNPSLVIPIQSMRGLQGEIRLWQDHPPLTPSDERLLKTFANQGLMALERSRLAQSETRARVLEESDRLKSALLSSVSHELRTPLATIKAAVSSLRSQAVDLDPESRMELLAAIEEETDHLNQLVSNLLNMSRIEAGSLIPQRRWNVLAEIVASTVSLMRQAAQHHRIVVDVSYDLPLVPVDYVQMEQVFTNLISNSIKYSPENTTICIEAHVQDDETLHVQVTNQGPPVPTEHLGRIFDKFYRITAADRVSGIGLGLSICKGIIEAHGGRIWAENLPEGFTFKFTLPLTWQGEPPHIPVEL
jgi:two-component system sensor histidine kinase KdpD